MSSSRLRTTLVQTAIYAVGIGASKGVALLLVPLYTRQMPPADIAIWDLCTTTILFAVAIAEIGMASALARFYIQADNEAERLSVSRTAMAVVFIAAVTTVVAAWLLRDVGAAKVLGDETHHELIVLLGAVAALTVISNQPLAQLRAQERSIAFSMLNLVRAITGPAVIVYLVVAKDLGVKGILLGEAAGLGLMGGIGLVMSGSFAVPWIHREELKKLLRFGVPIIPIGLSTAVILVSDRYFLRAYVGLEELAVYTIGFKVATIMALASQALQTAWAPSAFRIAKQPDAADTLAHAFRVLALGILTLALLISAVAPELVSLFAPAATYGGASIIVPLIVGSYALQAINLLVCTNLVIANRTIFVTAVLVAGATVKLTLNGMLIPAVGIVGAASATLLSYAVQIAMAFLLTAYIYPVRYETGRLVALTVSTMAAGAAIMSQMPNQSVLGFAVRVMFLLVFFGLVFGLGIVSKAERRAAGDWARTMLLRWQR